jgi:hypothetical protein
MLQKDSHRPVVSQALGLRAWANDISILTQTVSQGEINDVHQLLAAAAEA